MNLQLETQPLSISPKTRGSEIFYPESDGKPMAETDLHAKILIYLKTALELFFAGQSDVYVTGNIMFYFVEGEPTEVISPDVMVCFGIPKGDRTSYKTWEENDVVPSVIIEVSSRGTWTKDRVEKRLLYEMLGVEEYFIFNPLYPKHSSSLLAFRLTNGAFESLQIENERVESKVLSLDLVVSGRNLLLFNPETNEYLKNTAELAETVGELTQEIGVVIEENRKLKSEVERLKKLLEPNKN